MKILVFLIITMSTLIVFAGNVSLQLRSVVGDKIVEHNLKSEDIEPDQMQFFLKKAHKILKQKSHDVQFCKQEKIELSLTENEKTKSVTACVRSKTKLTREMKSLANLIEVQYGKP